MTRTKHQSKKLFEYKYKLDMENGKWNGKKSVYVQQMECAVQQLNWGYIY